MPFMSQKKTLEEILEKALAEVLARTDISASLVAGYSSTPEKDVQAAVRDVANGVLNPLDLAGAINQAIDDPSAKYASLLVLREKGEHALVRYETACGSGDAAAISTTSRALTEKLFDFALQEFSIIRNDLMICSIEDIVYLGKGDSEKTSWLKQARDDWYFSTLTALNVLYASALEDGDLDRAKFIQEKLDLLPDPANDFYCSLLEPD
jgi:hypothetical protein